MYRCFTELRPALSDTQRGTALEYSVACATIFGSMVLNLYWSSMIVRKGYQALVRGEKK